MSLPNSLPDFHPDSESLHHESVGDNERLWGSDDLPGGAVCWESEDLWNNGDIRDIQAHSMPETTSVPGVGFEELDTGSLCEVDCKAEPLHHAVADEGERFSDAAIAKLRKDLDRFQRAEAERFNIKKYRSMHFAGLHMGDDSKENDPPTDSNETQTRKDRQSRTASPSLKRKHHCLSELSVNIGDRGRSKLHRKSHWAPPPSSNPPSSPSVIDLTDLPSSPIQSIDLTELPSSPVRGSTGISTDLIGQPHNLLITHDEFFGQWIYNMPLHGLLRYARDPSQSMGFKEAASSELERRFLLAAGMVLNGSQVVVKDVM